MLFGTPDEITPASVDLLGAAQRIALVRAELDDHHVALPSARRHLEWWASNADWRCNNT